MYEFIYDILKYVLDLFLTDFKYENYILTLLTGIIIAFAIINAVLGGVLALISVSYTHLTLPTNREV